VAGKRFENGAFRKRWSQGNHVIFLAEFSSNKLVKVAFLNFSGVLRKENV